MESYLITGGNRLSGAVRIHGAKNSVLPILAATILCSGQCTIENCPDISDADTSAAILRHLGCAVARRGSAVSVDASGVDRCDVPVELMRDMRSSVLFLGALTARCGRADLVTPGGCALGARPIDLHLFALERLGVKTETIGDRVLCRSGALRGGTIAFPFSSVGATENAMLAASACPEPVRIENAAREPEIADLARFLRAMGADIGGEGTGTITVRGGRPLSGARFAVMPDRIETATYLSAAAACGGELLLEGADEKNLRSVTDCLRAAGCEISGEAAGLRIRSGALRSPGAIRTAPYPGFPTDAQAPVTAALLRAKGVTEITESIFENRMRHVPELRKMGADIALSGSAARVSGVERLTGAEVRATDLRCGAALVVAALSAEGQSRVFGVRYINRGYEGLEANLRRAGAEIALEG